MSCRSVYVITEDRKSWSTSLLGHRLNCVWCCRTSTWPSETAPDLSSRHEAGWEHRYILRLSSSSGCAHHSGTGQIEASFPLGSLMVFLRPCSPSLSILWNLSTSHMGKFSSNAFLSQRSPLAFQGFIVHFAGFNPFQSFQTFFLALSLVRTNNFLLLKHPKWGMLQKWDTFLLIILREQNFDYIRSNALNLIVISKFRYCFIIVLIYLNSFLCVATRRLFLSKRTLLDYLDSKQRKSIITEKTNGDDLLVQLKMCAGVCALQMVRAFVQPHLSDDLLLRQNHLRRQSEGECSTRMCVYMFSGFFLLFYIIDTRTCNLL